MWLISSYPLGASHRLAGTPTLFQHLPRSQIHSGRSSVLLTLSLRWSSSSSALVSPPDPFSSRLSLFFDLISPRFCWYWWTSLFILNRLNPFPFLYAQQWNCLFLFPFRSETRCLGSVELWERLSSSFCLPPWTHCSSFSSSRYSWLPCDRKGFLSSGWPICYASVAVVSGFYNFLIAWQTKVSSSLTFFLPFCLFIDSWSPLWWSEVGSSFFS